MSAKNKKFRICDYFTSVRRYQWFCLDNLQDASFQGIASCPGGVDVFVDRDCDGREYNCMLVVPYLSEQIACFPISGRLIDKQLINLAYERLFDLGYVKANK